MAPILARPAAARAPAPARDRGAPRVGAGPRPHLPDWCRSCDDASSSTSTTYSSTKTLAEIASASTADRARGTHTGTQTADTVTDGTTNKAYSATEKTELAGIATGAMARCGR